MAQDPYAHLDAPSAPKNDPYAHLDTPTKSAPAPTADPLPQGWEKAFAGTGKRAIDTDGFGIRDRAAAVAQALRSAGLRRPLLVAGKSMAK